MRTHRVRPDVTVLSDHVSVPGIGFLPVNAFVLHAEEPVVVDTGLSLEGRGFLDVLGSVLDPQDVRWIWLTHPDRDHTGALLDLLAAAPQARLVTTFLGTGILSTQWALPLDRLYLLNPGQSLDVGDRTLTAFRPPLYDSPATVGFYDDRSGACFSSDCYGAPVQSAELAGSSDVGDVPRDELRSGQLLWATIDSPWVHAVDPVRYLASLQPLRDMEPISSSAPTCRPPRDAPPSSSRCSRRCRRPTRSWALTSRSWRSCWRVSSRSPLRSALIEQTQLTVHVSPLCSSASRSPAPERAMAPSIWPAISSS